jgi:hypothetical protein
MPAPLDKAKVQAALFDLGVTAEMIGAVRRAPLPQAQALLAQVKENARRHYRRHVFELHPDRTGNDPEKTERLHVLTRVLEDLAKLTVQPPRPVIHAQVVQVQPVSWIRIRYTGGSPQSSSRSAPASAEAARRIVNMRPF